MPRSAHGQSAGCVFVLTGYWRTRKKLYITCGDGTARIRIVPLCLPFDWIDENRIRTEGNEVCLFSNFDFWTAERHQKGPHRRCFKMSPFFRLAVRMTGAVRSRYRTGFSHHSRTGGHPQARATLGKNAYKRNLTTFQYFFSPFRQFYLRAIFSGGLLGCIAMLHNRFLLGKFLPPTP